MKRELLEALTRLCVREVISQMKLNEEGEKETSPGAKAPPADNQGTADQPPLPKDFSQKELSDDKTDKSDKGKKSGIFFISPDNKSKLRKVPFPPNADHNVITRKLMDLVFRHLGRKPCILSNTINMVKKAIKDKTSSVYLYIGDYDPENEKRCLMADENLLIAKMQSVDSIKPFSDESELVYNPLDFRPNEFSSAEDLWAYNQDRDMYTGMRKAHGLDEQFRQLIKKMVNEILDGKR
ncbi:MAG TPA: hypothetical protein PKX15_03115 [Bacteroidales bacterium]|nr:hypothetical protein [Bacteroidales bacterium]